MLSLGLNFLLRQSWWQWAPLQITDLLCVRQVVKNIQHPLIFSTIMSEKDRVDLGFDRDARGLLKNLKRLESGRRRLVQGAQDVSSRLESCSRR